MSDTAHANIQNLYRIFVVPEAPDSTLGEIDRAITSNVGDFLQKHIVASDQSLEDLEKGFSESSISEEPMFVSDYTEYIKNNLIAHSVHTASPGFIGHMTSAFPYFMLPMSRLMTALNQNLVKVETSKVFTPMERQVLAMLHRLIYAQTDSFYSRWIHDSTHALGAFCSGGTIANITALWAARNRLCEAQGDFRGINQEGLLRALQYLRYSGLAVLVSRRAHYSLGKAADLLGIGRDNLIAVDTDENNRIDMSALRAEYETLKQKNIKPLAVIGIAGTTETGHIDPLEDLADFAAEVNCHFHVDAAWGGPTLFSDKHRILLKGIERADSVTIDAHKQLYVPMGAGMVLFRDPRSLKAIEHHANYIIRQGSKDIGSHTLEGSRPGMAMLVHAGLSIIGRKGYGLLIDQGIERAHQFAALIDQHPDFELMTEPELNILTYRYNPQWLQEAIPLLSSQQIYEVNLLLDQVVQQVQKLQREEGQTFVSRTRLKAKRYPQSDQLSVFRSVLANPLTTPEILQQVLDEQCTIVGNNLITQRLLDQIAMLDVNLAMYG
jgi:glutamate decarboxylase